MDEGDARRPAEAIAKRPARRVAFKFYPGGVMGNDATVLRKLQIGQLHGGAVTVLALARVYPDSQLYGLPMLFRSHAEVDYVRSRMDATILAGLDKEGLVAFGLAEGGFAYVMSNGPVRRIADLRAQKVWAPEGDAVTRTMFEVGGVAPVVLPLADVYTGLQTGLVLGRRHLAGGSDRPAVVHENEVSHRHSDLLHGGHRGPRQARLFALSVPPTSRSCAACWWASSRSSIERAAGQRGGTGGAQDSRHRVRPARARGHRGYRAARGRSAHQSSDSKGLYTPAFLQALEGHLKEFRAKGRGVAGRR